MVGSAPPSQLSSTRGVAPDRGVRFAVATASDEAAIRRLLRENPMRGAITLTFEREPDYFRGTNLAGAEDRTIVAFESERLICMGRCTTRECWVNGRPARTGYLGELRLDHTAQGRFDILRGGYRFFRAQQSSAPADFYFTSLASDNARARQLLERRLPGLPRYAFLNELTTLLVATAGPHGTGPPLESATAAELMEFFNTCGARHHFAAAWTAASFASLATHDLPLDAFGVIRRAGRIVAAGALWDQRAFRQTVIHRYTPALAAARPLLNALAPLLRTPRLPPPGRPLAHAFLSPLAIAPEAAALLPEMVGSFLARAAQRGLDYLTLALPSTDARLPELKRRFRCRTYASRLYRVTWPGEAAAELDARPVLPDVSLL